MSINWEFDWLTGADEDNENDEDDLPWSSDDELDGDEAVVEMLDEDVETMLDEDEEDAPQRKKVHPHPSDSAATSTTSRSLEHSNSSLTPSLSATANCSLSANAHSLARSRGQSASTSTSAPAQPLRPLKPLKQVRKVQKAKLKAPEFPPIRNFALCILHSAFCLNLSLRLRDRVEVLKRPVVDLLHHLSESFPRIFGIVLEAARRVDAGNIRPPVVA